MTRSQEIARFWTMLKALPEFVRVYVSKKTSLTTSWIDVLGKTPKDFCGIPPRRAFLFFVDMEPEANWAHVCYWIVLRHPQDSSAADYTSVKHGWPPKGFPVNFELLTRTSDGTPNGIALSSNR